MKEKRLTNWNDDKNLDCLLFFALRIKELVFDYTLDSFKYPALNTSTICTEAIELISEIENENVSEKSIIPVLEELIYKIKNDSIVKEIIDDISYYINFGDYSNLREIKLKIEILHHKLSPRKYIEFVKKRLTEIIKSNKEKKLIYELSTNYISSLINLGYSQAFINLKVNSIFFSKDKIENFDSLEKFFSNFEYNLKIYTVILKASDIFDEISNTSPIFKCEITNSVDNELKKFDKKNFLFSKNKNQRFLVLPKIKCYDPLTAKNIAEYKVNKLSKLFVFFHHRNHPDWSKKALVIENDNESFIINERVSAMAKNYDWKPKKAAIKLNSLIKGLQLDKSSFSKYDRVIDLHGLSVQNKIIENQLLQNWIAFETLLVGYNNTSKIDQVIQHLLPFLLNRYIRKQIDELIRSINRFDSKFFFSKIRTITEGENIIEKFTALLVLEKYKATRFEFYEKLEKSPLAKFRMSEFHTKFSDLKSVKSHIENHKRKVTWQIKRMYRSRNLIVHVGIVPDFTEILVENSHTYLDILVNTINYLSIKEKSINSIEQAIKEAEIINSKNKKAISSSQSIDEHNYISILL
ncbi:hypothetical protein ABS768_09305 [Flavobacterium sp. ST-75]|uniref:Apea-like HEPN domain-containing protein n=1 Tax=Flavobacterium rhizophilum TaxID=3163296 RepID=A0ABW8YD69_9FLAO